VFVERLWTGPGTVRVFPLMDNLYPADGVPGAADIARVAEHIDAMRPSGAVVTVVAPTRKVINITITSLGPDTPATREAALAELRDTFRRLSRVAVATMPAIVDAVFWPTPQSFSRSWIWQAIANATGEQRHILTVPAADVALAPAKSGAWKPSRLHRKGLNQHVLVLAMRRRCDARRCKRVSIRPSRYCRSAGLAKQ
jgi:uncharacterized phage protein gp47/JayE